MQRHSTSNARQPESRIRHSSPVMRHSPFRIPHSAFCIAALVAFAAGAASAAAPALSLKVDGGYSMGLELFRPGTPNAPWAGVYARPCAAGRPMGGRATTYNFNAVLEEATFATLDDLYRWQQIYARRDYRDPGRNPLDVWLCPDGDTWRLYLNGVYVNHLPRVSAASGPAAVTATPGFPLALNIRHDPPDPAFETVDITERANANGLPGLKYRPATGAVTNVAGVPFLLSRDPSRDHIDLAMSWNPAAQRVGTAACHANSRWQSPLAKTPLRYQFQVPGRDYDALYVLCATDPGRRDAIPRFTAQFYRKRFPYGGSGRPFNFASGEVPAYTNAAAKGEGMALGEGGRLWLVRIPLSGDLVTELGPEEYLCFELTKDVEPYRTYADPLNHSWHAGGLPSAVRVFGVTLGKAPVSLRFDPLQTANLFEEGERVGYRVTLRNNTSSPRTERLSLAAADWFATDRPVASAEVALAPGEEKAVELALDPKKFGWYEAFLDGAGRTWRHTFVRLRARERGPLPFEAPGLRVGTRGMLSSPLAAYVAGKGGWDTPARGVFFGRDASPEYVAEMEGVLRRFGIHSFAAPENIRAQGRIGATTPIAEGIRIYTNGIPSLTSAREGEFRSFTYFTTLCEPGGIGTDNAGFPEYFGEPTNAYHYSKLTGTAADRYAVYKRQIEVVRAVHTNFLPKTKLLMPHGSWNFMIPFLQDPDTRPVADGVMCDFQFYTRLPEEQMHQCSLNSLWYFRQAWAKYRPGEEPLLVWGEGPDVTQPYVGGNTEVTAASHLVRISMLMMAYGCSRQLAWVESPLSVGENHCSGGLVTGFNALDPDLSYAASAAWTRQARHAVHEGYTPVGSTSAFCQNFRDTRSGSQMRAVWTVRGTRPFVFDRAPEKLTVYDPMDNVVPAGRTPDGKAVVVAGEMPFFVYGAEGAAVALGDPDHSDSAPAKDAVVKDLGAFADLFGEQTADADEPYVQMMPSNIRRFQATMDVAVTNDAAEPARGAVLSVSLPTQAVDRMVMPYYTCLTFKRPVAIPGKAAALLLDVKAASDWGRVVYVLRDAAGRRWYSCGFKGEWNGDDMEGQSVFCFDGWRTLRFELPSNAPWDNFRNLGFTNWGSDDVKARVVLPVALEKVFVERRNGVMYGTDFHRFEKDVPVLLGALRAEYATESDATDEPVRLQRVQAPMAAASLLVNPIADMAKANALEPGRVVAVKDPDTWFDGTRGVFTFEMPEEAVSADLWIAPYADGRGALKLGKGLKASPAQVGGFLAGQTFHAFLVWRDKAGNESRPSAPFAFRMEDHFAHQ